MIIVSSSPLVIASSPGDYRRSFCGGSFCGASISGRSPFARLATWGCLAMAAVIGLCASSAQAQTVWELSPYKIEFVVGVEHDSALTPAFQRDMQKIIEEKSDLLVGAAWNVRASAAPIAWKNLMVQDLSLIRSLPAGDEISAPEDSSAAAKGTKADPKSPKKGDAPSKSKEKSAAKSAADAPAAKTSPPLELSPYQIIDAEKIDADKLILISVRANERGVFVVAARELDLRTRIWGNVIEKTAPQRELIPMLAFRCAVECFSPLATIEDVNLKEKTARLRIRAGAFPTRDPSISLVPDAGIFLPVYRLTDRVGKWRKTQIVPWTYLYLGKPGEIDDLPLDNEKETAKKADAAKVADGVKKAEAAKETPSAKAGEKTAEKKGAEGKAVEAQTANDMEYGLKAKIHSGLRAALTSRRRGRMEVIALGISPPPGSTRLHLASRSSPDTPLAGYEIYSYSPNSRETTLLGRTDRQGEIDIPPGPHPLRLLLVKYGGAILAKLPLVPGTEKEVTAHVAPDHERLAGEGVIAGLQESLVDLVTRREILMFRARAKLKTGEVEEAAKILNELQGLTTRDDFVEILRQNRPRSTDAQTRKKIEKMFQDTESLLGQFLDPDAVTRLEKEVRDAEKQKAAASAKAPPANDTQNQPPPAAK